MNEQLNICSVRRKAIHALELIGRKTATIGRWKEQRRRRSAMSQKRRCVKEKLIERAKEECIQWALALKTDGLSDRSADG